MPPSAASYLQKVLYAIEKLAERGGSSYQKIEAFLRTNYPTMDVKHNFVMKALRNGVDTGLITQDGHSYKLTKKTKATVKKEGKIPIKKTKKTVTPTKKNKEKKKDNEEESNVLIVVESDETDSMATYLIPQEVISDELDKLLREETFHDVITTLGVEEQTDEIDIDQANEDRWKANRKFFKQYKLNSKEKMEINTFISRIYTLKNRE